MGSLFEGDIYKTYSSHYVKQQNISHFNSQNKSATLCFAMAIVNLMRPEWFKLPCTEPLLKHLVCANKKVEEAGNGTVLADLMGCLATQIQKGTTCFDLVFKSANKDHTRSHGNPSAKQKEQHVFDFHELHFLTDIVKISPIIIECFQNATLVIVYTYQHHFETYSMHLILRQQSPSAFHMYKSSRIIFPTKGNVFKCSSSHLISIMCLCDMKYDCPEKSDEDLCKQNDVAKMFGRNETIQKNRTMSGDLFLSDPTTGYLVKYSSPVISTHCKIKKHLHAKGNIEFWLVSNETKSFTNKSLFECDSNSETFDLFEICSYRLNDSGFVIPCSNGKHIEKCRDFTCNILFKCPQYYCIPWEYVCNGMWDCPLGADETLFYESNYTCGNMFKCKDTTLCIHVGAVCDGFGNCPQKDDEYHCELKYIQCPFLCECLLYAIVCTNTQGLLTFSENGYPYVYLHLENVVVREEQIHNKFSSLISIEIINTEFSSICQVWSGACLIRISATHNHIPVLPSLCFVNQSFLQNVFFGSNGLEHIKMNAFSNLTALSSLSFFNNSLTYFSHKMLSAAQQLKYLSLSENSLKEVDSTTFSIGLAGTLVVTSFHVCCYTPPEIKCISKKKKPLNLSCSRLLPQLSLKITFITVAVIIFILNLSCTVVCLCEPTQNKGFSTIVVSVTITNLFSALIFVLVLIADSTHKNTIVYNEKKWRSSAMCFTVTEVFLVTNIISPCIIFLLSFIRFRLAANPLRSRFKVVSCCIKYVSRIIMSGLLTTAALSVLLKTQTRIIPSLFCIPVEDPTHSVTMIPLIIWILSFHQTTVAGSAGLFHCLLIKKIQESAKVLGPMLAAKSVPYSLYVQLMSTTLSNILSWLPSNVIFICAFYLPIYPTTLIPWTLIIVASLNSLVNPVVFVSTSLRSILRSCVS